jgi:hypothetical protein
MEIYERRLPRLLAPYCALISATTFILAQARAFTRQCSDHRIQRRKDHRTGGLKGPGAEFRSVGIGGGRRRLG